jgi:RecA/RadA recombinase
LKALSANILHKKEVKLTDDLRLRRRRKSDIQKTVESFTKKTNGERPKPEKFIIKPENVFPTGSTTLNLALTDTKDGGWGKGKISNLIGDSDTGKTFLSLTGMAEMAISSFWDDYYLIYDDAEEALGIDIKYLFGSKVYNRITRPLNLKGKPLDKPSNTIQDFMRNLLTMTKLGRPFFYCLDSLDSITSEEEIKRLEKEKEATKENSEDGSGPKKKGSYKTEKPKALSELLRVANGPIKDLGAHLLVVSQTRDNIGFGAMFQPKIRSGGRALKFYCTHEVWLSNLGKETKTYQKITRPIGSKVGANITKNKLTGKKRQAEFSIYYDYGVDDITSCIDFLLSSGFWKKSTKDGEKNKIKWERLGITENKAQLIETIENRDLQPDLYDEVESSWKEIEEGIRLGHRKRRFE